MPVFRLLFDGRGRIGRGTYLLGHGVLVGLLIFASLFAAVLRPRVGVGANPWPALAMVAMFLLAFWSWLALSSKRLRDMDQSPWWTGLFLAPGIGFTAVTLFLLCLPGTDGPNRYGPQPA